MYELFTTPGLFAALRVIRVFRGSLFSNNPRTRESQQNLANHQIFFSATATFIDRALIHFHADSIINRRS